MTTKPSWEVWASASDEIKNETARVMAGTWKCPVSFARHHIDVDRENDRLRAALAAAEVERDLVRTDLNDRIAEIHNELRIAREEAFRHAG